MISDEFVIQLRAVFQAQHHLVNRIGKELDNAERALNNARSHGEQIAELQRMFDEIEKDSVLLEEDDFGDFDPDSALGIHNSRNEAINQSLRGIEFRDWSSFVLQCQAYNFEHGLDSLLPYESLLTDADYQRLQAESYEAQYRWDQWDYVFVGGAAVLAALTDFFLVRIPRSMRNERKHPQQGSALTEWLQKYDIHDRNDFLARWCRSLEERCKVPYDAQFAVVGDEAQQIAGMGGRSHRLQSLGHDPVLGFVFGVLDILRGTITGFSYDKLTGLHQPVVGQVWCDLEPVSLLAAFLPHLGHLISDAFTPMGLPAPFMTVLQGLNVGSFGEKERTAGQLVRWMYRNGYDLRHFLVSGLTPGVIELVLRAYIMIRHYAEHGETQFLLAGNPKYRSMLCWSHALAGVANAGKVALYQGNPLAINFAEWMAFFRYLVPSMKYWLFDKQRLRCEHLERISEQGWQEIEKQTSRIMRIVTAEDFPSLALGLSGTSNPL
jgi:hypothetical protein